MGALGVCRWLVEEIGPGHMVIVDQYIDRTKGRPSTFFGDGAVAHVSFGDPVCSVLASALHRAAMRAEAVIHNGGTYVCMEGPAFSTRAESRMYRVWGGDVIGMTNLPEAKLAREAEMAYATLAMATDYDCWKEDEENVSVDQVIAVQSMRSWHVRLCGHVATEIEALDTDCSCMRALDSALFTPMALIPEDTRARLAPMLQRLLE